MERLKEFRYYAEAPKELVSQCNLCGGREFKLLAMTDRYGFEAPTVRCKGCGLEFLSLRMTPDAYREFYAGGHYRKLLDLYYGGMMTLGEIEAGQVAYANMLTRWLAPRMAKIRGGLLLDLGGSTGVVADRLAHDYDLDATVVEPSDVEADKARDRGLAVAQVPVSEYEAGGNHYDLVTLCQTVDHLLDIRGDLERIRGWVAPGGRFFVDYAESALKIDHPFYLTQKTMTRFLEKSGFRVAVEGRSEDGKHFNMLCGVA